jgi:hypothetical protein
MNYESYIASHRWRTNAARVRELAVAQGKCRLCSGEQPLEAHHRDYDNLGDERDSDLVALCGECHREVTCFLGRGPARQCTARRGETLNVTGKSGVPDPSIIRTASAVRTASARTAEPCRR